MPQEPDRREEEPARDVLAAEAFAVPAADPVLSHQHPIRLPDDPTGIPEAHDILAAEEFAMPAPGGRAATGSRGALAKGAETSRRGGILASAALLGAVVLRRRRGK
jgi:hypothetical protein